MAPHILVIIQQGLWASLTGGWFYDAHQNVFCNTFHLYLWLFLLCLPLTLYLTLTFTPVIFTAYCAATAAVFVAIKFINHRLHFMYDTGMPVEEDPIEESGEQTDNLDCSTATRNQAKQISLENENTGNMSEAIEMTTFALNSNRWPLSATVSSMTPPVLCSSRASESSGSGRRVNMVPADSMEYIRKLIKEENTCQSDKLSLEARITSAEGVGHRPRRSKECLSQSTSRQQCRLSAETVETDPKNLTEGSRLSRNSLHAASNIQQTNAIIEGVPKSSPILRPMLSSPVRKGHGHRHRRAVRCASTSAGGGGDDGSGDLVTSSLTDPCHPESQKADSESVRARKSTVRSHFRPNVVAREDEKRSLETFSTAGVVGSPVHSDLSSLSSYKETSPESETIPPKALSRLLELSGIERVRRQPIDALKAVALSHSRDSLDTYKTRSCRKSTDANSFTSDKVIVHRDASSSLELDEIGLAELSSKAESNCKVDIESDTFIDSNTALKVESHCIILSKSQENQLSLDSIEAVAVALATTVDLGQSSAAGSSQSETKSESSRTLTASSGIHSRTVNDGLKRSYARKIRHERAKSVTPVDAASVSLVKNAGSSILGSDWLGVSTDSDDSHSSGEIRSHSESSDSSSTLTNDEMSAVPVQRNNRHHHHSRRSHLAHRQHHYSLKATDTGQSAKDVSSDFEPVLSTTPSTQVTSVASVSIFAADDDDDQESIERQRARGAIPKRRVTVDQSIRHGDDHRCSPHQLPIESVDEQEQLEQRMLQILSKSSRHEMEEELQKLRIELSAKAASERNSPRRWTSDRPATPRMRHDVQCRSKSEDAREARSKVRKRSTRTTVIGPSQGFELKPLSSSRESSTSNQNEMLALLPSGVPENVYSRRRHAYSSRSSWSSLPKNVIESVAEGAANRHVAKSHDDTTEGAIHCFQDEQGNWLTYTFGEDEVRLAPTAANPILDEIDKFKRASSSDESTYQDVDMLYRPSLRLPTSSTRGEAVSASCCHDETSPSNSGGSDTTKDTETSDQSEAVSKRPKRYYWLKILPKRSVKVQLDRLDLLALLDRNTVPETILSIVLAVSVSLLGSLLLYHGFFQDFAIFWLCVVIASSQYSLFKSVQPDAASPMHGYNHAIIFSRPSYFCLCGCLVLALHYASLSWRGTAFRLYGAPFTVPDFIICARDLIIVFLLCLPVIFTLGLLPQINTFLMYLLEQIELHVFGGTASTSVIASVFSVARSCFAVASLYGLCYIGIKDSFGTPSSPNTSQHVLFSLFCGVLVPICYHLSRSSSDPSVIWDMLVRLVASRSNRNADETEGELCDPLPHKLQNSVCERLKTDLIVSVASAIFVFAVSVSTAFSSPVLQPVLFDVLVYMCGCLGLTIHYIIPHLRKEMPWMCCSQPVFVSHERSQFEVKVAARVMMFERFYVWLRFFESNFMLPTVFLCALTQSTRQIVVEKKFEIFISSIIIVVCSIKMFRSAFANSSHQFVIIVFTMFFFRYDFAAYSESFLIDYFCMSIVLSKVYELMLRLRFILTYIAPWQIPWGSAFHAFAQPFSVPHSAMLFLQALVSALLSAPLNPLLGSAIFVTSYMRPLRFWERDYNTKRVDHSNTRLLSQVDYNPGADDNNLNSIFYEHLTRSLQHSLCGDLMMGRWGNAVQGDFFIIASDYLNALVHLIEMGNGFVTFQLRGLEFRGTYCQQREVEAITEDVEGDGGFCCCKPGHLPRFLSLNMAFSQRWLAWEVVVTKYILEGYSISDNSAAPMLQAYDLRKVLISFYVKSIIYYTVRSLKLDQWLENETIREGLRPTLEKNYVDLDPTFAATVDEDYDHRLSGVSKNSFSTVYLEWIQYCAARRDKTIDAGKESWLVALCFGLSLLGRRALGTASHNNSSANVEFFLGGLHSLFKGDLRITSSRDEWVFSDMELLRRVVAPGIRMSLKLHQDHFTSPEEYDDHEALYDAVTSHEQTLVISHEADPAWRNAVLSNVPSLLALRHVFDDGSDEYKVIMLNKRFLSFRVIKVNRECVRGLWAGQLQELIFLRNRNPERGSIQNAKQALRNMINSSCDQPIGYPIYVSPLTTSYSGSNQQYTGIVGRESSFNTLFSAVHRIWTRLRTRCGASCTSGSSMRPDDVFVSCRSGPPVSSCPVVSNPPRLSSIHGGQCSVDIGGGVHSVLVNRSISGNSGSGGVPGSSPVVKVSGPLSSLTGLITADSTPPREIYTQRVQICDLSFVYDNINVGTSRRSEVQWPHDEWRTAGGRTGWNGWTPSVGDEGTVVHRWTLGHRDGARRSTGITEKVVLLVQIGERFVPVGEPGLTYIGIEV